MRSKGLLGTIVAVGALALAAAPASAQLSPNPWIDRGFLNIAHQGGEDEAPSNTLYALKSSVTEGGADAIEIDVQLTQDGHLVVIHDDTFARTSCTDALCGDGSKATRGESQIRDMTLSELKEVDAAYWFQTGGSYNSGAPASAYVHRGIATGQRTAPAGYVANDFTTPTLREVLDAFPSVPVNIEIKMPKSTDPVNPRPSTCGDGDPNGPGDNSGSQLCDDLDLSIPTAQALAALLNEPEYTNRQDIIVVSFAQEPLEAFHNLAEDVHLAPSQDAILGTTEETGYLQDFQMDPVDAPYVAFQVPPSFGPLDVLQVLLNPPYTIQDEFAVHIWTNGPGDETPAGYARFYNAGADGVMTTSPRKLHRWLCDMEIPRPSGADRCPNPPADPPAKPKKCKKGQKKVKRKGKVKCVKKGKKKRKKR